MHNGKPSDELIQMLIALDRAKFKLEGEKKGGSRHKTTSRAVNALDRFTFPLERIYRDLKEIGL